MTLKEFITEQVEANQKDEATNNLIERIGKDDSFPNTSEIKTIAQYIYVDLDHNHTLAFQKLLMLWQFAENNYEQPTDGNILVEINHIVDLQTNDPNYKYG